MKHKVTLEFDDAVDSLHCGLRVGWVSGVEGKGKKKTEVDLSCGAGTGQPWLIFSKTKNGRTKYLVADIREIIPQLNGLA